MNADEIIKALRWIAKNDEIVFNAEMANNVADILEQSEIDKQILINDNALKQKEIERLKAVQPVTCGECVKYHKETGWCDEHGSFVNEEGGFCHPWESYNWKMFMDTDYCSYGERRVEYERD